MHVQRHRVVAFLALHAVISPVLKALSAMLGQYSTRIVFLEESVASLKDEINIFKGEKKRPDFKPSALDKNTDKKRSGTRGKKNKRAKTRRKRQT